MPKKYPRITFVVSPSDLSNFFKNEEEIVQFMVNTGARIVVRDGRIYENGESREMQEVCRGRSQRALRKSSRDLIWSNLLWIS